MDGIKLCNYTKLGLLQWPGIAGNKKTKKNICAHKAVRIFHKCRSFWNLTPDVANVDEKARSCSPTVAGLKGWQRHNNPMAEALGL